MDERLAEQRAATAPAQPPAKTAASSRRSARTAARLADAAAVARLPGMAVPARPLLTGKLAGFGTTIFAEMSALAARTGAINLGQGFPDTDGPESVREAAVAAMRAGVNQYPPGPGIPELRAAIAEHQRRFYGIELDPDGEVLVTTGATEAIAAALLALCEPGDEVVTFEPYYDSYAACIALAGAERRTVVAAPARLRASTPTRSPPRSPPRTRAVLVNSPHNPTGKVFTRAELELIAAPLPRARRARHHRRGLRAPRVRRARARPALDAARAWPSAR